LSKTKLMVEEEVTVY